MFCLLKIVKPKIKPLRYLCIYKSRQHGCTTEIVFMCKAIQNLSRNRQTTEQRLTGTN